MGTQRQLLHAPTRKQGMSEREMKNFNIPRGGFVGNCLKARVVFSRAVLRVHRSHYGAVDFSKLRSWKTWTATLKEAKKKDGAEKLHEQQELVFHTRLLLLTFREFHMKPSRTGQTTTNGPRSRLWKWFVCEMREKWKLLLLFADCAWDNDPENNVWFRSKLKTPRRA